MRERGEARRRIVGNTDAPFALVLGRNPSLSCHPCQSFYIPLPSWRGFKSPLRSMKAKRIGRARCATTTSQEKNENAGTPTVAPHASAASLSPLARPTTRQYFLPSPPPVPISMFCTMRGTPPLRHLGRFMAMCAIRTAAKKTRSFMPSAVAVFRNSAPLPLACIKLYIFLIPRVAQF